MKSLIFCVLFLLLPFVSFAKNIVCTDKGISISGSVNESGHGKLEMTGEDLYDGLNNNGIPFKEELSFKRIDIKKENIYYPRILFRSYESTWVRYDMAFPKDFFKTEPKEFKSMLLWQFAQDIPAREREIPCRSW